MRSILMTLLLTSCTQQSPQVQSRPVTTETTPTVPLPAVQVIINEVMSNNESTAQDETFAMPDWVELLNTGDVAIELSRLALWDSSEDPWIPREGVLQPGAYLLLFADDSAVQNHLPFRLNSVDGDELHLAVDSEVVDSVEFGPMPEDVAYARLPDGGDWALTAEATPEATNPALPSPTLDPSELLFVADHFTIIDLQLTPANYNTMNSWSEVEVPCEMTIDGVYYENISVRLKGSASFDLMDGKPAFKLDLNEYVPGQEFRGLKAFMLHNGNVFDPTRARDFITYKLAREAGIAAPRVGWIKLTINGFDYGLYINVETHDDRFIERYWPGQGTTGMLFEPDFAGSADFGTNNIDFDYEEGPVGGDPLSIASIVTLNDVVKRSANDVNIAEMWTVLDDDFLTYMAWEAVINHSDGYRAPNNWRFYVNATTRKIHFVPSGAEWTWSWEPDLWYFGGDVAQFCVDNLGCREAYAAEVLRVADLVQTLDLEGDFDAISTWLSPEIDADIRSPHSTSQVSNARSDTWTRLQQNPNQVRDSVYTAFPGLMP